MAKDIGIDLGTASVLVYVKGKGIVLNEPSVVAMDKNTGKLLKVGEEARQMLGRTPGNIVAIRPLREGVISDYDMTERMLKEFIRKVAGFMVFKPRVIICVPSGITEVEERAVVDAGIQSGCRRVYLIEEPVAAAIGAGIDITKPDGHMVVDIGGGTADIAVISLSGVVESSSIKVAGDQFNEAVVKYMRRKHNILVGESTAEKMKIAIGCVYPKEEETTMDVKGRVHQRHRHDRRRQPGGGLRQAHRVPHGHCHHCGGQRHRLCGRGHRQEPGYDHRHAGGHHQPLPAAAGELSLRVQGLSPWQGAGTASLPGPGQSPGGLGRSPTFSRSKNRPHFLLQNGTKSDRMVQHCVCI